MPEYAVVASQEIALLSDGRVPWRPVAAHLGITSFGANVFTASQAGDPVINEHDEDEPNADEELYVVLSGAARFRLGDEERDAPAGSFVYVAPGVLRGAIAQEPDTAVLAVGGTVGQAYVPRPWSVWAPFEALYAEGRYAEVADRAAGLADAFPGSPGVLYNLACCESLAGRPDDALEHLARACELEPAYREFAREDSDLDPVREDPRFGELVVPD
jgi:hypothetical protein